MSVHRTLVSLTIALAVVGGACGGSDIELKAPAPIEVAGTAETSPSPTADATPADVPTLANGEPLDESYMLELESRMTAAPDLASYLDVMGEFVAYLDSAPAQEGVTETWSVDETMIHDLAAQYGVSVDDAMAQIDAHPVVGPMFRDAEVEAGTEVDVAESIPDVASDASTDELLDDAFFGEDWDDAGSVFEPSSTFAEPALAEISVPWGSLGDHSCGTSVASIESQWDFRSSGAGAVDEIVTDADTLISSYFSSEQDALEVYAHLDRCEAERLANRFAAAVGVGRVGDRLSVVTEEADEAFALRVFEDTGAALVVVIMRHYEQIVVVSTYGIDVAGAVERASVEFGL